MAISLQRMASRRLVNSIKYSVAKTLVVELQDSLFCCTSTSLSNIKGQTSIKRNRGQLKLWNTSPDSRKQIPWRGVQVTVLKKYTKLASLCCSAELKSWRKSRRSSRSDFDWPQLELPSDSSPNNLMLHITFITDRIIKIITIPRIGTKPHIWWGRRLSNILTISEIKELSWELKPGCRHDLGEQ